MGLYPNPQAGLGQQQTGSRGLAEQDYVMLSQEVVTARKLRLSRQVADQQVARAAQDVEVQRNRILTDVRIAFYNLVVGQEQQNLSRQLLEIARENLRFAERQRKGDREGENDVIEAQVEFYTAEITAFRADNHVRLGRQRLAAVSGARGLPPFPVAGDFKTVPSERTWQDSLGRIQQLSPEIAGALASRQSAQVARNRATAEAYPNVTFNGLVNWRDNGIGGRPDGGLQVGMPLPIYDRNQGGRQQARHNLAAANLAVQQLELDLQNRLADVFEQYANARRTASRYRDQIIPAARKALDLTREGYNAGDVNYNDLLTSQRTYARANLEYLDALRELWSAEWQIEGLLLTDSLTLKDY